MEPYYAIPPPSAPPAKNFPEAAARGQSDPIDESSINMLLAQGYTRGLANSLNDTKKAFAKRIWIVDNSGSMNCTDGHRFVETRCKNDVKMVPCSRWEEIQECVQYHIQLACSIGAPTEFRFLNDPGAHVGPQRFIVAEDSTYDRSKEAMDIVRRARPTGVTPLTAHVMDIHREIRSIAPQLRAQGQKVAIVIATDGLPSDEMGQGGMMIKQQFINSLRSLEGLPVWLVIRLCTDEDEVVEFYNELDSQLELSIEVLDDFVGEAKEIYSTNPWLNYALPIHRMREMGYHDRVFDLLDERLLTKSELRDFFFLLFGSENFDGVPDPSAEWDSFARSIEELLKKEKTQWDPIKFRMKPWVNMYSLNQCYSESCNVCSIQ